MYVKPKFSAQIPPVFMFEHVLGKINTANQKTHKNKTDFRTMKHTPYPPAYTLKNQKSKDSASWNDLHVQCSSYSAALFLCCGRERQASPCNSSQHLESMAETIVDGKGSGVIWQGVVPLFFAGNDVKRRVLPTPATRLWAHSEHCFPAPSCKLCQI